MNRLHLPLMRALAIHVLLVLAMIVRLEASDDPPIQIVETFPIETDMGNDDLPEAFRVWLDMIEGARTSLDFAEFYVSNQEDSRLEPILHAIERAASRGIQVRFLAEKVFYKTYPTTLDRLNKHDNINVQIYDVGKLMGGVLHAKYFIVDRREAYFGSQNFDWRALTHIQELGLRIRNEEIVRPFVDVFETDWKLASGGDRDYRHDPPLRGYGLPIWLPGEKASLFVTPVFSPKEWLPDEQLWDLPLLVELIDQARQKIRIQLLSYRAVGRDKTYFDELETPLRSAAARGVKLEILLSDWSKRAGQIEGLKSLQVLPNIEVKLVTVPQWSGGFIPFARVVHSKYMVVDDRVSWIGTSNWEKDYFYRSRNVGLIVDGTDIAKRLVEFFDKTWTGPYAQMVEPEKTYTPPRIAK